MRIIGNILAGNEVQSEEMLKTGVITAFEVKLEVGNVLMKKEILWCVSNILAGSSSQINSILNSNLLKIIIAKSSFDH